MTAGAVEPAEAVRADQPIALSVDDLVVTYGNRRDPLRAVDGVSLRVARGETFGVIGESGSGKSTLIMAVAGLLPVSGGRVRVAPRGAGLADAAR
jgi:ABC-type glutathione transport system ATPase component